MKKYTIIYGERVGNMTYPVYATKYRHIECHPTELRHEVEMTIGWDSVHFVLDGHCEATKD